MKKGGLVLEIFFISILLISLVFGACTEDQRILRLNKNYNGHAEVYNGVNAYTSELCYTDFFSAYMGANPHACSGTNTVLYLEANTNSHVSTSNTAPYATPVCYGDLVCTSRIGSCAVGETAILSLNKNYNSHATLMSSRDINYNTLICCMQGGSVFPIINTAVWANSAEAPISSANNNEVVKMIATTANIPNGEAITFRVYRGAGTSSLLTTTTATVSSSRAVASYTIPDSASLPAGSQIWFNASYASASKASGILTIAAVVCQCTDGTACNTCSSTKPLYCGATNGGASYDNCQACGCPNPADDCNADGSCSAGTSNPTRCMHYDGLTSNPAQDEAACLADVFNTAIPTVEEIKGTGFCTSPVTCFCRWVAENNPGTRCEGGWSTPGGECLWNSVNLKDCDQEPKVGFRKIQLSEVWSGDPADPLASSCTKSEILDRRCLSSALLEFFDYQSLVIVLSLVFILCLIKVYKQR